MRTIKIKLEIPESDQTYKADPQMLITIVNLVHKLKRNCYICDLILLIYTSVMYNLFAEDIYKFVILEVAMILIMGFIQYSLISAKSKFITRTAVDIKFSDEYVIVNTAEFDGPLWFKKAPVEIRLRRGEIVIKQVNNPFPHIFKTDSHTLKLRQKNSALYIMTGYFPWGVAEELKKVTH